VFVRHGESTWNEIFNRDTGLQRLLWMPLRVVRGLVREASALLSSESTFLDSPLSGQGIQQAVSLREALVAGSVGVEPRERPPVLLFQALKEQDDTTSVIVASNLLRAIETITIALADSLVVTGEQIYVRSELQEISRNFDAISLSTFDAAAHSPH
jgi:broad specificity phosphatase PhoE